MNLTALAYLFACNFLGGVSYVVTARALTGASPQSVVLWRTVIGAVLFLPFLYKARRSLRFSREDWLRMAGVGTLGYALPLSLGTIGQDFSTATNASLLIGVEPVSIVLLSAVFLGETLGAAKVFAVACGVFGSVLIVAQGIPFWNAAITPHFKGDLLLLLHGGAWSLYTVLGKPALRRVDSMTFTAVTTWIGLVPLLLLSLANPHALPSTPQSLFAVIFLGLGVTFLGTLFWNRALELAPASMMANFIFLQPVVGTVLGILLQKDPFSSWSAAGGALILTGMYCAARDSRDS